MYYFYLDQSYHHGLIFNSKNLKDLIYFKRFAPDEKATHFFDIYARSKECHVSKVIQKKYWYENGPAYSDEEEYQVF